MTNHSNKTRLLLVAMEEPVELVALTKQEELESDTDRSDADQSEERATVSADPANGTEHTLKRDITLFSGIAYLVGNIIGSGIFITPKNILCHTGSFGLSLVVWVLGGVVAMAGGLCYVELAQLIKKSGGDYIYIKEIYSFKNKYKVSTLLGSLLGFMYVWSSMLVIRASSLAIITLTCGEYLVRPFFVDCKEVPENAVKLVTLAIICELQQVPKTFF